MRAHRALALCVASVVAGSATAGPKGQASGTYIEEEQRISGLEQVPPQTVVVKSWFQGDRLRKELQNAPYVFLIDLTAQRVEVLDPSQKTYWRMPRESYLAMTQASLQVFGVTRQPDGSLSTPPKLFTRTGVSQKIGSWNAYEVEVNTAALPGGRVRIWMSTEVGLDQQDFLRSMQSMLGGGAPELEGFFGQLRQLKGYPVMTRAEIDVRGQRVVLVQELKVARRQAMATSLFTVPADYRETASPAMPAAPSPPAGAAEPKGPR